MILRPSCPEVSGYQGGFFYFVGMDVPHFLKPGDQVAVVATAKRLEKSIEPGIELLKSWGLKVVIGNNVNQQNGYFAGTDEERINDLQLALDSPSIKAIVFARGGYGTTRILEKLDFTAFKKSPKWLVGFSDLTSILLQASAFNIASVHGPVCMTIGRDTDSDVYLKDLLFGNLIFDFSLSSSELTREGKCRGKIVGGNLSLIYESIGAPNEIETRGNILFMEEVSEGKYSIDRMMNKLRRSGKLDGLSGVLIGDFSSITDPNAYFKETVEEMLMQYFAPLNIPIAFGLSAGHEKANYPLIMGLTAEVIIGNELLKINYLNQEAS